MDGCSRSVHAAPQRSIPSLSDDSWSSNAIAFAPPYQDPRYLAIAPALFDRAERGVELAYQRSDIQRGFGIATKVGMEDAIRDVAAAVDYAALRRFGLSDETIIPKFQTGGSQAAQ